MEADGSQSLDLQRDATWIEEIDPNIVYGTRDSGGFIADRRPGATE